MEKAFELLKATRNNILIVIEQNPPENLFTIPEGANNHIFWNVAHTVVTQQILCYKLSGLDFRIPQELVERYRKGTVPSETDALGELVVIKDLAISTVETLRKDFKNGIFTNFSKYETSYGYVLENIEDAISFNNVHEAMHLGQIKQMSALLRAGK